MRKAFAGIAVIAVIVAVAACSPSSSDAAQSTAAPVTHVTALFVGDSYTEGVGLATPRQERWSALVSSAQGWTEVNAGCSGSGYTRQGLLCGTTFEERIASLTNVEPDVVVIWGGVNDAGATSDHAATAASDTIAAYAQAFPGAQLIVLNAVYFASPEPEPVAAINATLPAAVREASGRWVDIGPLLAENPGLIGQDGLHPNAGGHKAIADALLAALSEAGQRS
jgi:lysophospholipase L1-like esterase